MGGASTVTVQIEVYLLYKAGGLMTPVGYTKGGELGGVVPK
jgi:hypothetical protein